MYDSFHPPSSFFSNFQLGAFCRHNFDSVPRSYHSKEVVRIYKGKGKKKLK